MLLGAEALLVPVAWKVAVYQDAVALEDELALEQELALELVLEPMLDDQPSCRPYRSLP